MVLASLFPYWFLDVHQKGFFLGTHMVLGRWLCRQQPEAAGA